jgi:hypothetical protein
MPDARAPAPVRAVLGSDGFWEVSRHDKWPVQRVKTYRLMVTNDGYAERVWDARASLPGVIRWQLRYEDEGAPTSGIDHAIWYVDAQLSPSQIDTHIRVLQEIRGYKCAHSIEVQPCAGGWEAICNRGRCTFNHKRFWMWFGVSSAVLLLVVMFVAVIVVFVRRPRTPAPASLVPTNMAPAPLRPPPSPPLLARTRANTANIATTANTANARLRVTTATNATNATALRRNVVNDINGWRNSPLGVGRANTRLSQVASRMSNSNGNATRIAA